MFEGDTAWIVWENNYSPGESIWTMEEFPSGHQPPSNFTAVADHERVHLSWQYPLDPVSNALRSSGSESSNTVEENRDQIAIYADDRVKQEENRPPRENSRDLTGTTVDTVSYTHLTLPTKRIV